MNPTMLEIGAEMAKVLQIMATTQTTYHVDFYDGNEDQFRVDCHWGKFVLRKVEQADKKLWTCGAIAHCEDCAEEHVVGSPFASETLVFILAVAVTGLVMNSVNDTCKAVEQSLH